MHKILLIDDATDVQKITTLALGKDYDVTVAPTLDTAQQEITKQSFDLILLDVTLPDGDGYHLCASLQSEEQTREIPVIFLTGKSRVSDKVMAFSLGADDYIVKPFEPLELRARIDARLKKLKSRKETETSVRKGDLRVNVPYQKAYLTDETGERELELTPIEFKILYYLAKCEGVVYSRDQILTAIWGGNVHVLDRTIDTHISALRKKLGNHAHYIESVLRTGYRFSSMTKNPIRKAS